MLLFNFVISLTSTNFPAQRGLPSSCLFRYGSSQATSWGLWWWNHPYHIFYHKYPGLTIWDSCTGHPTWRKLHWLYCMTAQNDPFRQVPSWTVVWKNQVSHPYRSFHQTSAWSRALIAWWSAWAPLESWCARMPETLSYRRCWLNEAFPLLGSVREVQRLVGLFHLSQFYICWSSGIELPSAHGIYWQACKALWSWSPTTEVFQRLQV